MKFDAMARFEIMAIVFYAETGFMAPGKDRPAMLGPSSITDSQLAAKWDKWNLHNRELLRRVFSAIEEYTE